jgi:adenylosuccinate lyase
MQQALPTTFGLKAAGWLAGLDGARLRLAEVVATLPVQYGGAARCGCRSRTWPVRLVGDAAQAQPVAAISARACARRAPGLAATLFAAMEQEHERSAGAWHSEWPTLTDLLTTVGFAAAWFAESLTGLRPDTARMAATVAAVRDPELAGALADALAPTLGRGAAHDAVADAVREAATSGRPLAEVLAGRTDVDVTALSGVGPDTGEAGAQVDAVLTSRPRRGARSASSTRARCGAGPM